MGRFEEAIDAFHQGLETQPSMVEITANLGSTLIDM